MVPKIPKCLTSIVNGPFVCDETIAVELKFGRKNYSLQNRSLSHTDNVSKFQQNIRLEYYCPFYKIFIRSTKIQGDFNGYSHIQWSGGDVNPERCNSIDY